MGSTMMAQPGLTPRQKAAVIVRLMLTDGDQMSLEQMDPGSQAALAHEMARMGIVDRATRDSVVAEFCDSLEDVGLSFPGGIDGTLKILGDTLSRDTTDRLRRIAAINGQSDPWERIGAMPARQLSDLALLEATEVAAVLFSKLAVQKAAETFALMPADRARQIAYAMSLTGGIEAPALLRIGLALLQAADGLARPAIDGGPVEKVGAILNFSTAGTRDVVLNGLDEDDADFAKEVRKSIFAWPNIPLRIDPRDIPRILRVVDETVLITAMAGAKGADERTALFLLGSLSTRLADSLRDEMEARGNVTAKDAEDAMAEIVAAIRRMEASGDLFLIAAEAADDDAEITISTAEIVGS